MKGMKQVLLMLVGLVLFSSCTNTVRSAAPVPAPSEIVYEQVITDPIVNAFANVQAVREGRTAGGTLQVQVDVYNKLPWRKTIDYRFEWIDDAGMVLESPTTNVWMNAVIEAKGTVTLQAIAPVERASDFRLQLAGGD